MSALAAIRTATAAAHEELEAGLDVFARLSDRDRHVALMRAFHGLYEAAESVLSARLPDLDYGERLKTPILRADLRALGAAPGEAVRPPPVPGTAYAFGFAYVLEGATLGGRVIHKRLRAIGHSLEGVSFFDAYGPQTGARWQSFCQVLERECADREADAVAGAREGFAFMREGLMAGPSQERRYG